MKQLILTSAIAVLLFSCENNAVEDSLTKVELNQQKSEASTGFENAPGQSGFIVTRDEGTYPLIMVDYKSGLTASIGVDNQLFCYPFPNFSAFELLPFQQVDVPVDPNRFVYIQKGYAHFEVFDGVFDFENDFICNFIQNTQLIASGMAKFNSADNDLFAFFSQSKNYNAWSFNVHGVLSDQNGDPVDFKLNYRGVWDGENFESTKETAKITLR